MAQIPRDKSPDSTLALLKDGYEFIPRRCQRYQSDIFETRLMLQKAICMTGEEAARTFYAPERFTRKSSMPPTTLMLLQDKGSVQLLDGEAHRWRKQMFMSLMAPEGIARLADLTADQWRASIGTWEHMDEVVLHDEVREILCRAVCEWTGVPLSASEAKQRTREFGAMIDGAGAVGPRNWKGMLLRTRTERWIQDVIQQVRAHKLDLAEGSAAHTVAWHRGLDGELLDTKVAAVELINLLRPTVAVARFVIFAALALHEHPEYRQKLQAGGDDELELFVQEVRRFYPFFPFVGGRVRNEFDWRGHHFAKGTWVLLDLYGTNHDARLWEEPSAFRPERFSRWDGSAFNFIPQGGGDHHTGHRCPGEWITIALVKRAVHLLTTAMRYDVPEQDLRIDLSRMPAIPKSRFVIKHVRPIH
jgi:fatty-acid peroxygenase